MTFLDKNDFDKKQLLEIKKGKKHGLSKRKILLYANKAFDNFQMKLIRKALENGLSFKKTRVIANPDLDFYQMLDNYWFNLRYMNSDLFTSFRTVDLDVPKYKIGDVLKYSREEQESKLPFELFLVRSNELFFAIDGSNETDSNGLNFSWTTKLIGLQEDGSTLPLEDPTNK